MTALSFPRVPEVAQLWDVLLDWWAISLAGGIALPASHKDLVVEYSNRAAALESLHQFVSTLHSSTLGNAPDVSRPHEFHTTFEVVLLEVAQSAASAQYLSLDDILHLSLLSKLLGN